MVGTPTIIAKINLIMKTLNRPFVAVITPLYNDADHIIRTIKSVHNQRFQNYVHLIYDDASTDNSIDIVREYINNNPDNQILLIKSSSNVGPSRARNALLAHEFSKQADYIAFLDSDDYWGPNHLEHSINDLNENNADMVYSTPIFIDDKGTFLSPYNIPVNQDATFNNLVKCNSIYISSVVLKKTSYEVVGEFNSELDSIEDWDYWLRILEAGHKIHHLLVSNVFYTIRENSMAGKVSQDKINLLKNKYLVKKPLIKLNLGCGDEILDGYINCDMDNAKADMLFDAAIIPFPDNSVDEIRAYHLIEHFPFQKGLSVLKEWFRALKPNGKLIMETPDLLNTCKTFVESDEQSRIILYGHFFAWPDLSPYQAHYFLFTETQMIWSLESVGFTNIQRIKPDSIYAAANPNWESCYLKVRATKPAQIIKKPPTVYDGFLFYNELDILELRLNELNDVVDRFILVESNTTFTGMPKPYYYEENKERFKQFEHKIIHIKVDDSPVTDSPWDAEKYQRNAIYRGLNNCLPDDIILISDVDEIPNLNAIKNYNPANGVTILQQKTCFYYFNCVSNFLWWNAKIGSWRDIQKETAHMVRTNNNRPVISEGGWHFTGTGGINQLLGKLNAFSHQEYNTQEFRDIKILENKIKNGLDIYNRIGAMATYCDVNDDFPKYIQDNKQKYIEKNLIKDIKLPNLPLDQSKYDKIKELNHSLYDEIFIQGGYMMKKDEIDGTVFVDVGANIGVTVIQALSLGAKKVLAFEPNTVNYDILNDLTLEYDNVNNYKHAVYNSQRMIQITNEGMLSNMFNAKPIDEWAPAALLSEVVGLLQKDEQAVLKLDCEGAEFDIIYKTEPENVLRFNMVLFEIHNNVNPQYLNEENNLIQYMSSLGFDCHKLPFASGVWYPDGSFEATNNAFYKCINKAK